MSRSAESPSMPETWTPVDAAPPEPPQRRQWWVAAAGPALLVLLLVLGGLVGGALGRSAVPKDPSPGPEPSFAVDPPVQVGDMVRGEVTESSGPAPENQRIVRADYSDGVNKVIFVMTWPEDDVDSYLADAGIEGASAIGAGTLCGTSVDTSLPACGRIAQQTGLLLLAVTEHATSDVATLLGEFEAAVTAPR